MNRKNEQEIQALCRENEDMKRKLVEGGPFVMLTNLVGRSFTSPPNPRAVEETKEKAPLRRWMVIMILTSRFARSTPWIRCVDTLLSILLSRFHCQITGKGFNKDRYDGLTDPDEHMDVYTTHMSMYTTDDVVLCWVFPTSLKGGTLSWFTKLPLHSVDSFATLMSKFEMHFATSRPHHLTSIALVGIRQEKRESLRTFVNRFGKVAMNIQNLSPDVGIHQMLMTLRLGLFANSLCI